MNRRELRKQAQRARSGLSNLHDEANRMQNRINELEAEVERLQREIFQDQDERGNLLAEVERLMEERRWRDAYGELPEPLTEVLVFRRGIGIDRGSWCPEQEEWYTDDGDWFSPTHWQPLPAPPATTQRTPAME